MFEITLLNRLYEKMVSFGANAIFKLKIDIHVRLIVKIDKQ